MNFRLVKASQFLQQFKLDIQYKPGKEYIILDALSCLASINVSCADPSYSKLDVLFMYSAILIEIHPNLLSSILAGYEDDEYWAHLYYQVQANEDLGNNKALLPFVTGCSYKSDSDPYMSPRPESSTNPSSKTVFSHLGGPAVPSPGFRETTSCSGDSTVVIENSTLPLSDKTKLLYYVNRTTRNL